MSLTRREFLGAAAALGVAGRVLARDEVPVLRAGLVGCGSRGTGAAEDVMKADPNVHVVALGDLFEDRLHGCRAYFAGKGGPFPGYRVEEKHCYTGFDAYKRVIDAGVDLVLFATPPGFRPLHAERAVDAGKHVFLEKPAAVAPAGVRRILAAGEKAKEKNLAVVAGTIYRHHAPFLETIRRVHDGAIGEIHGGRAYYNVGKLWHREREAGWSDMEYQIRNWYYHCWLGGDHIVEQHVHTIDVTNWVMGGPPVRAVAVGGRQVRTDARFGEIYDHFSVDYEYPGGVHVHSMCRQMPGCANHVGAYFRGAKGTASPYQGRIDGESTWAYEGKPPNPYVQEHVDMIASIRAGTPLNEAKQIAESTLTAILGREAAYTGASIAWEEILKSDLDLWPEAESFGAAPEVVVPMPGQKRGA